MSIRRCICLKTDGKQCTRDVSHKSGDDSSLCWQHQKCQKKVQQKVPQKVSQKVPQKIPQKVPQKVLQKVPQKAKNKAKNPKQQKVETCLNNIQNYEEIRDNVLFDDHYFYKIVDPNSNDHYYSQKLNNTGLTPYLIETKECVFNGQSSVLLKMEKYDGTLSDYLKTNPSENDIIKSLKEIVNKSLKLNKEYKIRHGDFHYGNIVYKIEPDGIKWAFIDFELATEYDKYNRIIRWSTPNNPQTEQLYQYNPLYDLLLLEHDLVGPKNYIILKAHKGQSIQKYLDHFLSSQGPLEMEMYEDIEQEKKNLSPIVLTVPGEAL